jgi:uncharacterized membrane protein YsdA (DUF1294 family)
MKMGVFFIGLLAGFTTMFVYHGRLSAGLPLLYLVASILTFLIYAVDKSAAVRGRQRISESFLHGLAVVGGWPGALVAQKFLRHKSAKRPFLIVFYLTILINFGLFCLFMFTYPESHDQAHQIPAPIQQ